MYHFQNFVEFNKMFCVCILVAHRVGLVMNFDLNDASTLCLIHHNSFFKVKFCCFLHAYNVFNFQRIDLLCISGRCMTVLLIDVFVTIGVTVIISFFLSHSFRQLITVISHTAAVIFLMEPVLNMENQLCATPCMLLLSTRVLSSLITR